ncbi:MAG: hypothetical protein ND895_22340 [Pyrinomonadaceae bacterium]|nr:hypothetical protein [Pyrinomonadaceae bacterium]
MRKDLPLKDQLRRLVAALLLVLSVAATLRAQDSTAAERTARYFDSIRNSPPQLLALLLKMPKGGDLHNHLSGAIYAESYIQWAADKGLCVNLTSMTLVVPDSPSACDKFAGQAAPVNTALTNPVLYRQLIDAWSMRNWELSGQNGHDHFFDAFVKFGPATYGQTGKMLAEGVSRAARGHVLYVEFMLTPDISPTGIISTQIGDKVGWDGNFESTLNKLKGAGIAEAAKVAIKNLIDAETEKDRLLRCGTTQADPGCAVTIRYILQVARGSDLSRVFAQMVTGFTLANDPNSKVVALNLVQAEDGVASLQNYSLHMQMLQFLRPMYPQAHLTLHAGELAPGMVRPEDLTFHVREAVMTAKAERIGHGVDIMHDHDPYDLLKEMARRRVMVEICPSSSDLILGVRGSHHPLSTYLQYDVPVALATDDEGVARSEISREFLKAAQDHGLGYLQLKTLARNSLQYAFISGASLWSNSRKFTPAPECTQDLKAAKVTTPRCQQFLGGSEKAKLQWKLEEELRTFEKQY